MDTLANTMREWLSMQFENGNRLVRLLHILCFILENVLDSFSGRHWAFLCSTIHAAFSGHFEPLSNFFVDHPPSSIFLFACSQLGESCSWKYQFDVLAVEEMSSWTKECCDEMEWSFDQVAGGAQLRAHAGNHFSTSRTKHFHFSSYRRFVADWKPSWHWGDLWKAFQEAHVEEGWPFWNGRSWSFVLLEATSGHWRRWDLHLTECQIHPQVGWAVGHHRKAGQERASSQCLDSLRCWSNSNGGILGWRRCKDVQISAGHMSLPCSGEAGYPTNSASFIQLHGTPDANSPCALRKLGSYLIYTQDMRMHFPKAETYASTLTRWNGLEERKDGSPYEIELYSDSDWASCKTTRRSTSSGLIFVNSCCVHSHSRAQASTALSSMEAEILAATSLLVEGIQLKQLLQFLLGDAGGLSHNSKVQMRLRLDSTSAQSFFNRLGPGWAKHLSTRMMWSQQAMRRRWFLVERISTKENPADLNTKPLSRERREYLMKRIGLCSETFEEKTNSMPKMKQMVRLVSMMLMTGNLQGCDGEPMWMNPMTWTSTAWWTLTTIVLVSLVTYLLNEVSKLKFQMAKYKAIWETIRSVANLQHQQDPLAQDDGPGVRTSSFSGVWLNEGSEEEEEEDDDSIVDSAEARESTNNLVAAFDAEDREEAPQPPRVFLSNGTHGASPEESGGCGEEQPEIAEHGERAERGGVAEGEFPTTEEGIEVLTEAIIEIADGAALHGGHAAHASGEESNDENWIEEMNETQSERWRRYVQSGQDEVSDPDEWADIHYGPASSTARSRSRSRDEAATPASSTTPVARAMPKILAAQRDRRVADERAEEMVQMAESEREKRGVRQSQYQPQSSAGSSRTSRPIPTNDDVNCFSDSWEIANYYNIGLVPREYAAFEDYRWDLIMQGCGPETILVHNSRELTQYIIHDCPDVIERARFQRLLRSLQTLMVMFQPKDPNLWIDAAFNVKGWLEANRDSSYFEEGSTAQGSVREDEGEEEEHSDDDHVDPQDRALHDAEPGGGDSTSRPSSWDSDERETWEWQGQSTYRSDRMGNSLPCGAKTQGSTENRWHAPKIGECQGGVWSCSRHSTACVVSVLISVTCHQCTVAQSVAKQMQRHFRVFQTCWVAVCRSGWEGARVCRAVQCFRGQHQCVTVPSWFGHCWEHWEPQEGAGRASRNFDQNADAAKGRSLKVAWETAICCWQCLWPNSQGLAGGHHPACISQPQPQVGPESNFGFDSTQKFVAGRPPSRAEAYKRQTLVCANRCLLWTWWQLHLCWDWCSAFQWFGVPVRFFPKQFTVGVFSSFLRGFRPCVTGRVRLSGSVALFVSLHLSPFICLPSCVSLSGGVRLSGLVCALSPFICLPSCVSLSGGVRLSGLVCALSPFICLPSRVSLSGDVRLAGLVCALSPFSCLPSCVSLSGGVRFSGLVCALSPFICLPSCVSLSGGVRLAGLVCALSPFMCFPERWCPPRRSCLCLVSLQLSPFMCLPEWWCPPLRSFLCLVSLHVFPWVVVSASPVLSVPCLPSCVSLSDGVRLAGLVCALSPFICLPSCVSLSGGVRLSGLVCALSPFICLPSCVSLSGGVRLAGLVCALSPFMCLPAWWCPPLRSFLCLVSLHLSPFMCLPEWWCPPLRSCLCLVSLSFVSLHVSPWVVVSASPVLSVPCLPSFVSLSGGVRLSGLVCALSPFICLPSCVSLSGGVRLAGLVCVLSPFMCLPEWWCLPLRSCLCLLSLHLSPFMCLPEWWCPPLRSCLCLVSLHLSSCMCLPEWWCPPLRSSLCLVSLYLSPFMCLPELWCPPLRSCLCLVSLHVSPWVVVSASPVLSVPCLPPILFPQTVYCRGFQFFLKRCPPLCYWPCPPLWVGGFICPPSFVSLSGGVRLSGLVCALSPFICLPSCVSLSGGVRLSGLVCALSPFICLPSCVSLSGGVRLAGLVCALSPFSCLPWFMCLAECPLLRSCLCLVSLHVSPWVVVSASPVLSVPCLPSCVSLSCGVRLSGLVCALSPFYLSPFMCLPEWWCPPLRSFLCLVSLHVSPWVVVSASPVLSVPCLPSCVSLSGGVRLVGLVCALFPFI